MYTCILIICITFLSIIYYYSIFIVYKKIVGSMYCCVSYFFILFCLILLLSTTCVYEGAVSLCLSVCLSVPFFRHDRRTATPHSIDFSLARLREDGHAGLHWAIFSMGFLRLPRRHHYWRTTKWMMTTKFPSVMSHNKFDLMWRYLHLQDNTAPVPAGEKVWKLRWFLNHLNTRFQEPYTPYGHCTIDESMVKFKGRLSFRQYMPARPIKWVICPPSTNQLSNAQCCDAGMGCALRCLYQRCCRFTSSTCACRLDGPGSQLLHDQPQVKELVATCILLRNDGVGP